MIFLSKQDEVALNFRVPTSRASIRDLPHNYGTLEPTNSEEEDPPRPALPTEMAVLPSVLGAATGFSGRVGFRTFP
jgi:hypothetical protein